MGLPKTLKISAPVSARSPPEKRAARQEVDSVYQLFLLLHHNGHSLTEGGSYLPMEQVVTCRRERHIVG